MAEVPNVTAWAELMNFSRNYFSRKFKEFFGEPPSERLRQVRYRRVQKSIRKHPQETCYSIACRVGLKNDRRLYHFLNAHYDTNFTELRNELLKENENRETAIGCKIQDSGTR